MKVVTSAPDTSLAWRRLPQPQLDSPRLCSRRLPRLKRLSSTRHESRRRIKTTLRVASNEQGRKAGNVGAGASEISSYLGRERLLCRRHLWSWTSRHRCWRLLLHHHRRLRRVLHHPSRRKSSSCQSHPQPARSSTSTASFMLQQRLREPPSAGAAHRCRQCPLRRLAR